MKTLASLLNKVLDIVDTNTRYVETPDHKVRIKLGKDEKVKD